MLDAGLLCLREIIRAAPSLQEQKVHHKMQSIVGLCVSCVAQAFMLAPRLEAWQVVPFLEVLALAEAAFHGHQVVNT